MPVLSLTDDQVEELLSQLPSHRKRAALIGLATAGDARRASRESETETAFRRVAAMRGKDWDAMSDDERLNFADELIHEDRPCGS